MLGGADNSNGELQSYIIGANKQLVFHGFLAQQALQFFNLLHRRGQLRRGNNLFSCGNGREAAFLILLTPQEQLTGSNTMLTGDQRHGHTGFKALLNKGDFFPEHCAVCASLDLKHQSSGLQRLV